MLVAGCWLQVKIWILDITALTKHICQESKGDTPPIPFLLLQ